VVVRRAAWKCRDQQKYSLDFLFIAISFCSTIPQLKAKHIANLLAVNLLIKLHQVVPHFIAQVSNQRRQKHTQIKPITRNNIRVINLHFRHLVGWALALHEQHFVQVCDA
jgi:hypothetical protein